MDVLDKTWHLARNEAEIKVTEFEIQLWRVFFGFSRWQEECEKSVNGIELTANELAILHAIRMKDKPKTIADIGRLLNRNDNHNIRYSINKLLKLGLIEKVKTSQENHKNFSLQATSAGIQDTDAYGEMRKNILINMFNQETDLNLEEINKALMKIKAIYDEADRVIASYAAPIID